MEERLARIESALSQIAEAVQMVCEKQQYLDQQLDELMSNKILDRLGGIESEFGSMVGGLNDIIDGRRKREYSDGFREKHPEFGRYEDIGKRFGFDVYGLAADKTFDAPEEEREGIVASMLEELKGKFDDLIQALESRGTLPEEAKEGTEGGKVEVEIETSNKDDDGVDPKILDIARMFKGRGIA